MTDYSEEQRNELEALESIYPDSFTGAGPRRGRARSRRARGGAGGRAGAAAGPVGAPSGAARVDARGVGSLSLAGKRKRSMVLVARSVGAAPAAFSAVA